MNIESINGIGPKTAKLFNKIGIFTDDDLLSYYPYKYNVYKFNTILDDSITLIVKATVESIPTVAYIKRNFNKLQFRARINDNILTVVIYNRAFFKNNLTIGKEITLIGKYDKYKNIFTASNIKFNVIEGQIESIYHLSQGITNNLISKTIQSIINKSYCIDKIPSIYNEKYNFINKQIALKNIHFPNNATDIKLAKIKLIYEELFEFTFKINYLTNQNKNIKGIKKVFDEQKVTEFINNLPFKLTTDQDQTIKDIIKDFKSSSRMNRLILGDVGSGKTICAVISMYINYLSGYQSCLMAPTEILAHQHYNSIKGLLEPFNIKVELVTGSMTKREKQSIYKRVESNEINILIGTHSLLSEELKYNNLGLVITDEQHRFGVNQRSILQNKTQNPDVIYLSATPIPRTYALTIYGDLDISMIKTKPNGRLPIITKLKKETEIKDVLTSMLEELKKGHQIYVVSPLVEQNEESDLTSVEMLKEKLDIAFKKLVNIEIIHGKMKQEQKDAIMENFKQNKTQILISTTVIEVGIDVKNATEMVIFNAERFGLATLHQLRGRVGRNEYQSYCYLISNSETKRLSVMEESNDGFYISQKDFEIRGHGDLFGTKQSGDMKFKLADLKSDYEILLQAKKDSKEYLESKGYENDLYYKELLNNLDITD